MNESMPDLWALCWWMGGWWVNSVLSRRDKASDWETREMESLSQWKPVCGGLGGVGQLWTSSGG